MLPRLLLPKYTPKIVSIQVNSTENEKDREVEKEWAQKKMF